MTVILGPGLFVILWLTLDRVVPVSLLRVLGLLIGFTLFVGSATKYWEKS